MNLSNLEIILILLALLILANGSSSYVLEKNKKIQILASWTIAPSFLLTFNLTILVVLLPFSSGLLLVENMLKWSFILLAGTHLLVAIAVLNADYKENRVRKSYRKEQII